MKALISRLKLNNFTVWEDVKHYSRHDEVALFYPEFVFGIMQKIKTNGK